MVYRKCLHGDGQNDDGNKSTSQFKLVSELTLGVYEGNFSRGFEDILSALASGTLIKTSTACLYSNAEYR